VEDQRRLGIKERLPSTLEAAMHHLDKDGGLRVILGDKLVDTYLTVKAGEMEMLNGMEAEERRKFLLERY
jgi:glutamine synthetase